MAIICHGPNSAKPDVKIRKLAMEVEELFFVDDNPIQEGDR